MTPPPSSHHETLIVDVRSRERPAQAVERKLRQRLRDRFRLARHFERPAISLAGKREERAT
jgi:hypothetical protein